MSINLTAVVVAAIAGVTVFWVASMWSLVRRQQSDCGLEVWKLQQAERLSMMKPAEIPDGKTLVDDAKLDELRALAPFDFDKIMRRGNSQ